MKDVVSAAAGSVACCYTGQPFDTVKVRVQAAPERFSGPIHALVSTIKDEGVAALWKGAVPTALGMVAENGVAFGVHEQMKRLFPTPAVSDDTHRQLNLSDDVFRPFMMGGTTGLCTSFVLCPADVVKCHTQMASSHAGASKVGSVDIARRLWGRGLSGFYKGFEAQLLRDGAFYACFFGSYDVCGHLLQAGFPSLPDQVRYFLAGGIAGMVGWVAAMPIDVPKSMIQSRWDSRVVGDLVPTMRRVVQNSGGGGLFRGLGPALLRAFPANGALFLTVEFVRHVFEARSPSR